jgi:hypothetical protein
MKGDFSRSTFDRANHFKRVPLQQGRVQTDADANEQQAITLHRVETEVADLIGGCGGPVHDAGFGLTPDGDDLLIGAGRYYAGGVLCENEAEVPYGAQPDYPLDVPFLADLDEPPVTLPPEAGTYLAYLDVWERHLTALEAPHIREVALGGPDTATRTRAVWQVRLHRLTDDEAAAGPDCLGAIPSWEAATAPSTGELSARADVAAASDDPCIVAPGAGYRRLENQLYRVEVHEGGTRNAATFKWDRDNGSLRARLEAQSADRTEWTVSSVGRDTVLRFAPGDWAELTDDTRELHGLPGTLVQVAGVEGDVLTVDLADRLPVGGPVDAADFPLNPKVRRWNGVLRGVTNQDFLDLEDGVQVRLRGGNGDDGQPRRYRTGDYWMIPARTNTGDVEWPTDNDGWRPAAGIRHHYCRLALATFDGAVWTDLTDCRTFFPPVTELTSLFYAGGDGQECMPGEELPLPLRVGVANGMHPVAGARVRFTAVSGAAEIAGTSGGAVQSTLETSTDADGFAVCFWRPGGAPLVVEAALLDAAGDPVHLPVRFGANLSTADAVAYTPGDGCTMPDTVTTVQEALDELCRREGGEEPGIRVREVRLLVGEPLRNDAEVTGEALARGIVVACDGEPVPRAFRNEALNVDKPVCYVTLHLPYPFNAADRELWGDPVLGTSPLRLDGLLRVDDNEIFWAPTDAVRAWLLQRLFTIMNRLGRGDRVLGYLTLKGHVIWADDRDGTPLYLDGDAFGVLRDDGGTDLRLPSGDRRRGGDFELWFWLVDRIEGGRRLGTTAVPGIGERFSARLAEANVTTAGQLAEMEAGALAAILDVSTDRAAALIASARRTVEGGG